MHAVRVSRFGPPEVLEYIELPDPVPGSGEVRVRTAAVGVNFADITARMGLYPDSGKPPFITGYEFAGTVDAVGEGVKGVREGGEVIGMRNFGCYADTVVTSAALILPRPARLETAAAAAFPVTYITAWHAMVYIGNLHPGERVLIQNAGGGVGTAAVQIARHRGAEIFGTASAGKHDALRTLGVAHLFDYRTPGWEKELMSLTGGAGVEMILNPIGGPGLKRDFELLAHTGRLLIYGISSGAPGKKRNMVRALLNLLRTPRFSPIRMMIKNRGAAGVHIGHLWHRPDVLGGEFTEMLPLLEAGVLDPVLDRTFPLAEAAAAHHYIQDRRNLGKVILTT